jgi:hypothetical protein
LFYFLIFKKHRILKESKSFVKNYSIVFFLFLILSIAFFISNKIYLSVFKELVNAIILIFLFFSLTIFINTKIKLDFFIKRFVHIIILYALIINTIGWIRMLNICEKGLYDSLPIDSNFELLPLFFALIGVFYIDAKNSLLKYQKGIYAFILSIFSLYIFLSGSRRGIIVLLGFVAFLGVINLISSTRKNGYEKKIITISRYYLLSLIGTILVFSFFLFQTSCYFKNYSLELIGSKNIRSTKRIVTSGLLKYVSIFNANSTRTELYTKLYTKLWNPEFDLRDPDCGWEFRKGKRVFSLKGEGRGQIPKNVKGLLIDSTAVRPFILMSDVLIKTLEVKEGDIYKIEIFCYVSNDFDGSKIGFFANKKFMHNYMELRNDYSAFYNLRFIGTWQRIELNFACSKDGQIPIKVSIFKKNRNRSSFNGHLILAYPMVTKLESVDTALTSLCNYNNSNIYSVIDEFLDLSKKDRDQALLFDHITLPVLQQSGMFSLQSLNPIIIGDKDLIRNITSKFISEDSTYYPYKSELYVDTISSKFTGPRLMRWQFAWQIFTKEYNWKQKLFGRGFIYLNWYGYYFKGDKTKSDWPHNPFLSVLLYSGILGLILYIIVLSRAIMLYIKYRKEYFIFFIFFLITFFFAFFSANSPFTPPIWGFLLIFPYFIHSVHKKDMSKTNKIDLD